MTTKNQAKKTGKISFENKNPTILISTGIFSEHKERIAKDCQRKLRQAFSAGKLLPGWKRNGKELTCYHVADWSL